MISRTNKILSGVLGVLAASGIAAAVQLNTEVSKVIERRNSKLVDLCGEVERGYYIPAHMSRDEKSGIRLINAGNYFFFLNTENHGKMKVRVYQSSNGSSLGDLANQYGESTKVEIKDVNKRYLSGGEISATSNQIRLGDCEI